MFSAWRILGRKFSSLSSASVESSKRMVEVTWKGGGDLEKRVGIFPITWLRDNCQCAECFEPSSLARKYRLHKLDIRILPRSVKVNDDEEELKVIWPDGHVSQFHSDWLLKRDFSNHGDRLRHDSITDALRPKIWRREMADNLRTFEFGQFMEDSKTLLGWLTAMEEYGIALIENASTNEGIVEELGRRVANLRTTQYGAVWRVESKDDPSNIAYTTGGLSLHVDSPYYTCIPGVQILHYIRQPDMTGGENLFMDGFSAAHDLKRDNPEAFDLLSAIPVDFRDIGADLYTFHFRLRRPVIGLNSVGDVESIYYSNLVRDSIFTIPAKDVNQFYEALVEFELRINDPKNVIQVKPQSGSIMTINNQRVLHGRNSFVTTGSQQNRLLVGGYMDWDEMRSRRRVVEEELDLRE